MRGILVLYKHLTAIGLTALTLALLVQANNLDFQAPIERAKELNHSGQPQEARSDEQAISDRSDAAGHARP